MIAPGGQPTFVLSAATRMRVGIGEGNVKYEPIRRPCSPAIARESTAQPPARTRRLASANLPRSS